ncbi:Actin-like ATPase domain-containing protein [Madurella fahalii]|uniref:Actin-like ATPase domain-containing protein n=1 Tax=Madurella fahalii TaxID=1157608 RepID=A0ABQ0GN34_9PEZI
MASTDKTDNTILVGIDFGTTYSGVAFTWSNKVERLEIITSWESELHSNSDEEKAPTAISFDSKNKVSWGYSVPHDAEQAKWFKLLLIDEKDLPDDVRASAKIKEARAYLEKHNKSPIEVIAVFLRHLWNHCIQRITATVSRNLVNYSKFHIVMTLPAIWPEYARGRMKEAASQAGMLAERIAGETVLTFLSEPEAATLATLSDMDGRSDVKAGDSFVVVDCGGGTVDLISYEVVSIAPMVIKECVQGQGGLCGAVFVDEAFVDVLNHKLGSKKWAKLSADSRHRLLHDEWEHGIKPAFDGRDKTWKLNMPFECLDIESLRAGSEMPKIILTPMDVRGAFDPTVNKICAMVGEQVMAVKEKKKAPKYVIMAGGFGRCSYLLAALKKHLGHDIEVLQSRGSGPWTAICRGAVIHATGLEGFSTFAVDVQARIARVSCGVKCNASWSSKKHNPSDKFWDDRRQKWKARNQMNWLLEAGDDISTDNSVRSPFTRLYDTDGATKKTLTTTIYASTASPLPTTANADVRKLCNIRWDTKIDIASLPLFTNSIGVIFYELEFEVEMTCSGGSLDFAVYHNGKRQGSKHVMVDYETRS